MTNTTRSSRISGFYKLSTDERLDRVATFADLSDAEIRALRGHDLQRLEQADKMIENVVGLFHLPVGFAANFRLDNRDRLIPMVIEEPSVVAAASNAARLLRGGEGIITTATEPVMIGQIQLCNVEDIDVAARLIDAKSDDLVALANDSAPRLVARGGGARGLEVRTFSDTLIGDMLVVHIHVNVCDAMGANLVNGMCETLAPVCEEISGGKAYLKILSNLADRRLVTATGRVPLALLARDDLGMSGREVAERVQRASVFAEVDPYRAATHNKGIMNGVDAFLLATGQDWRAVEAGAHAHAARDGVYSAMATWRVTEDSLEGSITLPMQVGTVGGVVKVHPVVRVLLKVYGADGASDVGRGAAAVGLAQNLAAILALATEGIQRGHMSLHARNIAVAAGAKDNQIESIVAEMIQRNQINHATASSLLVKRSDTERPPLSMQEVESMRDRCWPKMESLIASFVPRASDTGGLNAMIWEHLDTGGKRLRATLPLLVYGAFGERVDHVIPFGATVELLHNGTLVQDDTEERVRARRGRETLWVTHGRGQAVLCGDAMLSLAQSCLNRLPHAPELICQVSQSLNDHLIKVIAAQIEASGPVPELERRLALARDRTGGLFSLAISGAALLGGASPTTVDALDEIGGRLGVVFHLQTELLQLMAASAEGSTPLIEGKSGILLSHALAHASPVDQAALRAAIGRTRGLSPDEDNGTILRLVTESGSIQYAVNLMQQEQTLVEERARGLKHPEIVRLVSGVSDVFLAPLLSRLQGLTGHH